MDKIDTNISTNIINLRKGKNMTQNDLARHLSYSDKTVSKWEHGYAIPDVVTLKEIADFFEVTVDYMISDHSNEESFQEHRKNKNRNRILTLALVDTFFIFVAVIIYIAVVQSRDLKIWPIFLWALGGSCLFNAIFCEKWYKHTISPYLFGSLAIWLLLLAFFFTLYVYNINYNFWYIFFAGIPIQAAFILIIKLKHS